MKARRTPDRPLIDPSTPGYDPAELGTNLNGPSLIRVPGFVQRPLGRFYLYFAHHQGRSIRLASADEVGGPWRVHPAGSLQLGDTYFDQHVASPDVHVDHERGEILMYFHGCGHDRTDADGQHTCLARSTDGVSFTAEPRPLCSFYYRSFSYAGRRYGLLRSGELYRHGSADGWSGLEERSPGEDFLLPLRGEASAAWPGGSVVRHLAVLVRGDRLLIVFSRTGDLPERLLRAEARLGPDWRAWRVGPARELLRPKRAWEGADLPIRRSETGSVHRPVHELRDPCLFEDGGRVWLVCSVAGESGLGLAELTDLDDAESTAPPRRVPAR